MTLEEYINAELTKMLNTDSGRKAVKEAMKDGKFADQQKASSDEAIRVLKECICNLAPPAFSSSETFATIQQMVDGSVSAPIQTEDGWEITVNFNQEKLKRPSLWSNSEGAYDIIGLFSQGWNIDENKKVPVGTWHGHKTVALRSRLGRPFVEDAVNFFMTTYANQYGVTEIIIDSLYKK